MDSGMRQKKKWKEVLSAAEPMELRAADGSEAETEEPDEEIRTSEPAGPGGLFDMRGDIKALRRALEERKSEAYEQKSRWEKFKWAAENPVSWLAGSKAGKMFFSRRRKFRKAVDERNLFYKEYKNQSAWTRFKWAASNPLAWAFGRAKGLQEDTVKRRMRALKIAKFSSGLDWDLDPNSEELEEGIAPVGKAARAMAYAGKLDSGHAPSESLIDSIAPKAAIGSMMGKTLAGGLQELGAKDESNVPGFLKGIHNDMSGSKAQDTAQGFGLAFNAVNGLTDARNAYRGQKKAREMWAQSDKLGAAATGLNAGISGIGAAKNAASLVKNALILADKTGAANAFGNYVIPGLDMLTGGVKAEMAGLELYRTKKIKDQTSKQADNFRTALSRADSATAGKLRQQIGFMNMANNMAKADHVRAGFEMASGGMQFIGGAASMFPAANVAGTVLKGAAAATDLLGKSVSKSMRSDMKREEIDRALHMKEQMEMVRRMAEAKKVHLTRSEIKHIVLAKYGYNSRKHAYLDLAQKRMDRLNELRTSENEKDREMFRGMVRALQLDPSRMEPVVKDGSIDSNDDGFKASLPILFKRIGVGRKASANMKKAIQNAKTFRQNPSWARG